MNNETASSAQCQYFLLVDDEPSLRRDLSEALEMLGHCVLQAAHGREALQMYEQNSSNIVMVITDLAMPIMGGVELCRELLRRDDTLKILVITGYSAETSLADLEEMGVKNWIQKPIRLETFLARVTGILEADS